MGRLMTPLEQSVNDMAAQRLLALCVFAPDPEMLAELAARYDSTPGWTLFGFHIDRTLAGLVGVRVSRPGQAVIQHIAVLPEARRQGVGRQLIQLLVNDHRFHHLEAETDGDAVEFYRCCGFWIHSLGEVYPGVERFRCILESPAS